MSFGFGHRFGSKSIADRSIRGRVAVGATDVGSMRLDGDEMTADPDDGDAGHATGTYMMPDPGLELRLGREFTA